MDESLKSARLTYLALLAVCATVLLFGFSPSKTPMYQAAIDQLETLASIDNAAMQSALGEAVNDELGDFDFTSEFTLNMTKYVSGEARAGIDFAPAAMVPHYMESFPSEASLAEIETYILADPALYVFKPDQQAWDQAVQKGLRNIYRQVSRTDARSFVIESLDLKDTAVLWKISNVGVGALGRGKPIDAQATLTIHWDYHYDATPQAIPVRGRFEPVLSATFSSWMDRQESLRDLRFRQNSHTLVFPKLRPVWDQVRASTIDAAIAALGQNIAASKKHITVLGLNVSEDVVSLVAPLAILSLVVYLLTHLKHIWQIREGNIAILMSYPWMALFPETLARLLTLVTLLLLPTTANVVILLRVWDIHSPLAWIGLACFVLSLLVEVGVLKKLAMLQREISTHLRAPSA